MRNKILLIPIIIVVAVNILIACLVIHRNTVNNGVKHGSSLQPCKPGYRIVYENGKATRLIEDCF